jgi:Zn-dependent metalloprotease
MLSKQHLTKLFSAIAVMAVVFSSLQPPLVQAQSGDGLKRHVNAGSGRLSFLSPESGRALSASKALGTFLRHQDPAMALTQRFGQEFGLKDPERDLSEMKKSQSEDGRLTVRYQQMYQGIPVMGGELIVNTNGRGDLYSINGELSPDISLQTQPAIDVVQARDTALKSMAKWHQKNPEEFVVTEPELWIYDESLLQPSTRPVELVWRMEVTPKDKAMPVRELVLVDAQRGSVSLHFNQVDTAWVSSTPHSSGNPTVNSNSSAKQPGASPDSSLLTYPRRVSTYTANGSFVLPGSYLCNQTQPNCTNGSNPHADAAHKYAIGTFDLYDTVHNRNSLNNNGMTIISTVHYCALFECPYFNAFWDGTQVVYGDGHGWPLADDVVAHELTHGVTEYESNLFYYYQSGAINESFSDLWGEYYDQINGLGLDSAGWEWYIGEAVSNGSLRSMADPTHYSDPDRMSSIFYYEGEDDNGGVHTNSGVNNKAVNLMVDGGYFYGWTVSPLGWTKTIAIYYEAQTNLLISGADYSDLYYALQRACSNLIGQKGITLGDCAEVKNALDAVQMNSQPAPNFNTDAPLCTVDTPAVVFADDLESGTGKWTFINGAHPRWQVDSEFGPYAQSGKHALFGDDFPDEVTDAKAQLASFVVPSNAYLHFAHAYGFEAPDYDGGIVEYSINGGSTWLDAGPLMDYNGYNGTIFDGAGNPLSGKSAFVGSSHGYISTRLDLASLSGKTVSFRWRMGLDEAVYNWGWWVDNIKVYVCTTFADVPTTHMFWKQIEAFYDAGITTGCSQNPKKYCPLANVTRGEMAVFLERAMGNFNPTPDPTGMFADVPYPGQPAAFQAFIEEFYNDGITTGCTPSPLKYCPQNYVTRGEMAVFIERALGNFAPTPNPTGMFADVPYPGQPLTFTPFIEQFYNDGITTGCANNPLRYCPQNKVTRQEMAVFIVRAFGIPLP